jgi:hypothetical protein
MGGFLTPYLPAGGAVSANTLKSQLRQVARRVMSRIFSRVN